MPDIRRKVELAICAHLTAATGLRWNPEKGSEDNAAIEPPCGIVDASESKDLVQDHSIQLLEVQVIYATFITDVLPPEHSEMVDRIHGALKAFPRGQYPDVVISGLDIQRMASVDDTEKQTRGDVFLCVVGATG